MTKQIDVYIIVVIVKKFLQPKETALLVKRQKIEREREKGDGKGKKEEGKKSGKEGAEK